MIDCIFDSWLFASGMAYVLLVLGTILGFFIACILRAGAECDEFTAQKIQEWMHPFKAGVDMCLAVIDGMDGDDDPRINLIVERIQELRRNPL